MFLRSVEDIESWMDGVEVQLNSEDLGKDLTSVTNLLKRHTVSVCSHVCMCAWVGVGAPCSIIYVCMHVFLLTIGCSMLQRDYVPQCPTLLFVFLSCHSIL